MNNKIIASTLGLMFMAPLMASAYTAPTPDFASANVPDPANFESHYDWITSLTDTQRESLKDLKKSMREAVREDLKNASDEERQAIKEALKAQRKVMKETKKAEFESLTETQKAELKELRGDHHSQKRSKMRLFRLGTGEEVLPDNAKTIELNAMSEEERQDFIAEIRAKNGQRGSTKKAVSMGNFTDAEKSEMKALKKSLMEKFQSYLNQ